MTLKPRILPIAQGTIVDIPHTTKRLTQVFLLLRRGVEAVTIGAIGHLQIISCAVNAVNRRLNAIKEAVLADRTLPLPGMNAGVSRGKA